MPAAAERQRADHRADLGAERLRGLGRKAGAGWRPRLGIREPERGGLGLGLRPRRVGGLDGQPLRLGGGFGVGQRDLREGFGVAGGARLGLLGAEIERLILIRGGGDLARRPRDWRLRVTCALFGTSVCAFQIMRRSIISVGIVRATSSGDMDEP